MEQGSEGSSLAILPTSIDLRLPNEFLDEVDSNRPPTFCETGQFDRLHLRVEPQGSAGLVAAVPQHAATIPIAV